MELHKMLMAIPDSYDDFVRFVEERIEDDADLADFVIEMLCRNPNTTTSDVLEMLCDKLGINEPLEIVPDEELVTA